MNVLNTEFMQGFIRMADDAWHQGWHERNGGNLTYRIKPEERAQIEGIFAGKSEYIPIGIDVPNLAGECFVTTGSGKYFQNVKRDPEHSLGIIEIDETGNNYSIVWGLEDGGKPTSELPTHLKNHEIKKQKTNGRYRVIYHCHPANIIALTFVLPLESEPFTRELWEMATECPVVFPDGIGIVKWMVPGGSEIAVETAKLMHDYDVAIWAHHGLFCAGEDFELVFGLAHTVEKSAEILVKVMSMTNKKKQTIEPDEFRHLAKDFNVSLPEKFLYEKID